MFSLPPPLQALVRPLFGLNLLLWDFSLDNVLFRSMGPLLIDALSAYAFHQPSPHQHAVMIVWVEMIGGEGMKISSQNSLARNFIHSYNPSSIGIHDIHLKIHAFSSNPMKFPSSITTQIENY